MMNPTSVPKPKSPGISLGSIAGLLMSASLSGAILGFMRTKLVNANFSALGPHSTDAYFAAFNIPDFFFYTLAAGALGVAFMPVLSDHLQNGDKKSIWELSSSLLTLLAIIMTVVGLVILVFARPLVQYVVAPNMTPEQLDTTVALMRLIAFNPLLFTITGILTSIQQTLGRFFFFALAPLLYNASIIASAIIFSEAPGHDGGPWHLGIVGLGVGAIAGGIAQLLIILVGMRPIHFRYIPKINWRSADFRQILRQLPPRSLDQGIDQLESIIETHFARQLGAGLVSYYNNAYILSSAPILLIGNAISIAAFPRLNARLSQGRPDLFRRDFLKILRAMVWITFPVVIVAYFCRGYLARLIFTNYAPDIAIVFGYLALAIFFGTLYPLISRWFYSQKDTVTPLIVSIFAIALNIYLVYLWAQPAAYGIAGLALAQSFVVMLQVVVLFTIMLIRDHQLFEREFWSGCARIVSVSGFSLFVGYVMIMLYPLESSDKGFFTLGSKLVLVTAAVFATHVGLSALFGLSEVRPIFGKVKQLAIKPVHIDVL